MEQAFERPRTLKYSGQEKVSPTCKLANWSQQGCLSDTLYASGHVNTIFMLFGWFLRGITIKCFSYLSGLKRKIPLSAATRWRIMPSVYTRHLLLHTALTAPAINTAKFLWPLPCPAVACCWVQTSSDGGRRTQQRPDHSTRQVFLLRRSKPSALPTATDTIYFGCISLYKKENREGGIMTQRQWVLHYYYYVFFSCEIYSGMGLGEAGEVWCHGIHSSQNKDTVGVEVKDTDSLYSSIIHVHFTVSPSINI